MAWTDFKFTPEDGLDNTTTFPSKPTSGAAARTQFMTILNQIKAFFNGTVKNTIDEHKAKFAKLGSQVIVVTRDVTLEGVQRINTINKPKAIIVYLAHDSTRFSIGSWSENGTSYAVIINLDELVVRTTSAFQQIHVHQRSSGGVGFSGKITNATDTGFDIEWTITRPDTYNLTGSAILRIQIWYG